MCTQANHDAIADIVNEMVNGGHIFTAFTVTQLGLQRGTTTESHGHLKSAVHAQYNDLLNRGYTRSIGQTPTGDTWVYHPVGADIQPFLDLINPHGTSSSQSSGPVTLPSPNTATPSKNAATPPTTIKVAATTAAAVLAAATIKKTTDIEGRLQVPKTALDAIGAKRGDFIKVEHANGKLVLRHAAGAGQLYVNNDGRLRISPSDLNNLSAVGAYKVTVDGKTIVIEPFAAKPAAAAS